MENLEKAQKETEKRKRKPREMAIFGNYRNYYGYRVCRDVKEDPRLRVFKREWFEGKDCLDIGCNQGILTINIAKSYCCRSMVGVDIDSFLVENAYWNLKRMSKRESITRQSSNVSDSEFSEEVHECGIGSRTAFSGSEKGAVLNDLLERVSFRKENFVKELYQESEAYDTILCLSVTKWIHLNWGDDGLITLFANIWRLLRLGGILLLEPQPWKSYQKNYQVSETASLNYHNIQFHPSLFQEILLDKVGFRMVENITERLPGSAAGFDRPIFAFQK
ncbi:hypothetical protein Scep_007336 [Stephania cephalantha]|uniref:RNA methyltransferase n=1 Tax=Stephania cephalantha TaxID=152367 RepID=A0AAP0KBM8_9MAGN